MIPADSSARFSSCSEQSIPSDAWPRIFAFLISAPFGSRAPIFARFQHEVYAAQPWKTQRFARFQTLELSNAWIVGNRDYVGLVPCFERELAGLGGDLPAFVKAHREKPGHRPEGCEAQK